MQYSVPGCPTTGCVTAPWSGARLLAATTPVRLGSARSLYCLTTLCMCVYLLTRVFGMGGNKACSYERRCIHNGEFGSARRATSAGCTKYASASSKPTTPRSSKKTPMGKFCLLLLQCYTCALRRQRWRTSAARVLAR